MSEKAAGKAVAQSTVYDTQSQSSDDLDDAAAWAGKISQDIDPAIERRVRRKIDLFFMPTFITGYGLVYYDKVFPFSLHVVVRIRGKGIQWEKCCEECP